MNTEHNHQNNNNIAQKKNDVDDKENENVQPVQKPLDEFKSHYLQNFEPICRLGKGGFGTVFEARNKLDDCKYAIKRIPIPQRQESRDCILREVKVLAKLEHPNIVKYSNAWFEEPPRSWQEKQDDNGMPKSDCMGTYSNITTSPSQVTESYSDISDLSYIVFGNNNKDEKRGKSSDYLIEGSKQQKYESEYDTTSDSHSERKETIRFLYIQMELCQKNSLRERLNNGTINRDIMYIFDIFCQIIQGVEYIHSQEFIHRDLKPSNILFSSDDQIKIGDFGSVTKMISSDKVTVYDDLQNGLKEQHTDQVGTQLYMSPEQIRKEPYNFKVDIYSLGVIFFEMLIPFATEMERCQTLQQIRNGTFPAQFLKLFELKTEKDLVCLMLSQDPEKRPTTTNIKCIIQVYLQRFDFLVSDSCPF
ncbi:eukaryotic translation initiation factor 2-alpha kinase 3-like [Myzus persicae]|uniref:eukaryotic translation initiation factor 2-alpha kinase 3-like n=1 Tax=Myzus persicae TaxID=13164 RepID=UPI000B931685|nr:eukaryotic translation initiation factor 2-alpha kinase 3-like [Myzus persicae]